MVYETELYHYGKPRRSGRYPWGSGDRPYQSGGSIIVRKSKKKSKNNDSGSESDVKATAKSTAKSDVKQPGQMTGDELREAVNRMQLEKQYLDLMKSLYPPPQEKVSAGKKFFKEVGGKILKDAVTQAGTEILKNAIKGFADSSSNTTLKNKEKNKK